MRMTSAHQRQDNPRVLTLRDCDTNIGCASLADAAHGPLQRCLRRYRKALIRCQEDTMSGYQTNKGCFSLKRAYSSVQKGDVFYGLLFYSMGHKFMHLDNVSQVSQND
jgi:hypothetical protein